MNIGFDAKRLFSNTTGLGNYSRTMVKNLQDLYPEHSYHLYTDRIVKNKETEYFFNSGRFIIHEGPRYFKSLWRSKFLVKDLIKDKIDVFHGLSNELPFGIHNSSIKSIVTIHDLIFRSYPTQYKIFDRKVYHLKTKYATKYATKIVSISNATSSDIKKYYSVDDAKIETVYQCCDQLFDRNEVGTKDSDLSVLKPYFLSVGSIIERKGLLMIARAVSILNEKDRPHIVVVGNGSGYLKKVKRFLIKNQLISLFHFKQGISNEELAAIYSNAEALIYPSLKEGFGIPIIEAGLNLIPIITSNISSLPEAGGPDIIQINPESPAEIAKAIISIEEGNYPLERCYKVKSYIDNKFDKITLSEQMMNLYQNL